MTFIQRRLNILYFGWALWTAARCFIELYQRATIGPWW